MRAMIRFGKQARLRFISHLDLQRFFQRAVNRTGLPIAYTQGFNPHPVMSFGSALALGWTSEYEVVDIKLSAPMGRKRTADAMRLALPEDLPVLDVRMIDDRHPAPMAQVVMSDYRIGLTGKGSEAIIEQLPMFMKMDSVPTVKKTKSGEKQINARPMVLSALADQDCIVARLMLTESQSLKPDLFISVLSGMAGVEPPRMSIHSTSLLGLAHEGKAVPIMEL